MSKFQRLVLRALALLIRIHLYERQYWANTSYDLIKDIEREL